MRAWPDQEAGLDAYEAMPVEAFGEAMLRGMGWAEGRCVGRNAKGVRARSHVSPPALGVSCCAQLYPQAVKHAGHAPVALCAMCLVMREAAWLLLHRL